MPWSWIVVLNQDGDNPAWDIIAVYDNPHPPSRCESVLAIEALASRPRVIFAVVRACNRREDRLDVIEQPRAATLSKVQVRAGVEHDPPAIWIDDTPLVILH